MLFHTHTQNFITLYFYLKKEEKSINKPLFSFNEISFPFVCSIFVMFCKEMIFLLTIQKREVFHSFSRSFSLSVFLSLSLFIFKVKTFGLELWTYLFLYSLIIHTLFNIHKSTLLSLLYLILDIEIIICIKAHFRFLLCSFFLFLWLLTFIDDK